MAEFGDGPWYVDLAPITDPELVPVTAARALGLSDQPGSSTMDTIVRSMSDRRDAADTRQLRASARRQRRIDHRLCSIGAASVTLLTTSREPIGVPGEVTWRVPSLSLDYEALSLFADRARRARPDFALTDDNIA